MVFVEVVGAKVTVLRGREVSWRDNLDMSSSKDTAGGMMPEVER